MKVTVAAAKRLWKLDEEHNLGLFEEDSLQEKLVKIAKEYNLKFDSKGNVAQAPENMEGIVRIAELQKELINEQNRKKFNVIMHAREILQAILPPESDVPDEEELDVVELEETLQDFLKVLRVQLPGFERG